MIDRYTKVLLTVIAVNLTVMTGWGALEVLVPEVKAYTTQDVWIKGASNILDVNLKKYADWPADIRGLPVDVRGSVSTCNICN